MISSCIATLCYGLRESGVPLYSISSILRNMKLRFVFLTVIICLLLNLGAADLPSSKSGGGDGGGATVSDPSESCTGYSYGVKVTHTLPPPTNRSNNITIAAVWSSFVMLFLAFYVSFVC